MKSIVKQVKENQQHDLKMELLNEYVQSVKESKLDENEFVSKMQKLSGYLGNRKYRNMSVDDIEHEKKEVKAMVAKISRAMWSAINSGAVTVGAATPQPQQPQQPQQTDASQVNYNNTPQAAARKAKQSNATNQANAQGGQFSKLKEDSYSKMDKVFESILQNLSEAQNTTKPALANYLIGVANSYTHGASNQPQFKQTVAQYAQQIEQEVSKSWNDGLAVIKNLFKSNNSVGGLLTSLCKVMYSSIQASSDVMHGVDHESNNPFVNQVDMGINRMDGKRNAKDLFNIATASMEKLADSNPSVAQQAIKAMALYTKNRQQNR